MKFFKVEELVDEETYDLLGYNAIKLINPFLLSDLIRLRENLDKKIHINDWHRGGIFSQRGYRTLRSGTGGITSQHRKGNAFDFDVEYMTANEVRQYILENKKLYPSINRMESGVGWVHIDCHPSYKDKQIYLFKP